MTTKANETIMLKYKRIVKKQLQINFTNKINRPVYRK